MATAAVQTIPPPVVPVEPLAGGGVQVTVSGEVKTLNFDPEALKIKYREERDKRLRPDGNSQWRRVNGIFKHYLDDPYTPRVERDPILTDTDFLVLGGGFGGLQMAARLMENGITNIRIIDKAGDFGGTWYWNRYPGAACDVESYVYMPLLEETNYIPSEKYAKAAELLEHSSRIGRHYDLYSRAIFHAEVRKMTWDEEACRWIVNTDRDDVIRARFVATASGPLNMPKLPGVPGIESYKGHSFHTSRWDYGYTGGNPLGGLDKIKDKRIGIIGTGATAVQAVPHLGQGGGEVFVFQRTPSSIARRDNKPTDPEWPKTLKPGWQEYRMNNFMLCLAGQSEEDLVNDAWTGFSRRLKEWGLKRTPTIWTDNPQLFELMDLQNGERLRARCEEVVKDKKTADALKTWYRGGCKRTCFHDEYLDTYNLPNVHLVDTDGKGVQQITEKGIIANGTEYELDCIIYSTGFEVGTDYTRRSNFEIIGRDGLTLTEKWNEGARTLQGFYSHGFPNLFIVSTVQSGYAANFVHMLHAQAKNIAWVIKECKARGIKTIETTQEAEDKYVDGIINGGWRTARLQRECTPGYYNREGDLTDSLKTKRMGSYGLGALAFCRLMEEWRAKGDFEGLECIKDEKAWE